MSYSVAASIGNQPFASGTGGNGQHLVYAVNNATWWVFWLSGTTTINAAYWNGTAWTTATSGATFTLPAAHSSEGRGFMVWPQTISTHDVFYVGFSTSSTAYAVRVQVSATSLTWGSSSSAGSTTGGAAPYGPALALDSSNNPYMQWEEQGDSHGAKATNTDSGTAWTSGWGSDTTWFSAAGSAPSRKILPGAGGYLLFLAGNGAGPPSTNLSYRYANANPTTTGNVFASGNTAIGDWDAVAADSSSYIVARINRSTNKLEAVVGTVVSNAISSFSALPTVPTSGLTFPNTTSGCALVSDGSSNVYLFVIDSGAGNNVKYCTFTKGSTWALGSWGTWQTLESSSQTRNSISACSSVNGSAAWVLWTETVSAGSQYSVVSGQLSLGGTTTTKTQSATARITANTTKTQTGTARVTATSVHTQTATARLTVTTTRTASATARVTATTSRSATATARVTATTQHTQAATARVTATTQRTQSATAHITTLVTTTKTQTATARVTAQTTRTQAGTARVTATSAHTLSAVARLTVVQDKTQAATARLTATTTRTQSATAHIAALGVTTRTQSATARVTAKSQQTRTATARVTVTTTHTQAATARLTVLTTRTQAAVARVTSLSTRTQAGTARVTAHTLRTQTATAHINPLGVTTRTMTATANITLTPGPFHFKVTATVAQLALTFAKAAAALRLSFASKQALTLSFTRESPVANPNTTISVTMTALDANGNPVSTLVTVTATVTFPDGTTSNFSLGSGITNAGSGKYTLVYTTKGQGENLEDWVGVDGAGNRTEYHNETPVSF
jgi:hypothetical protein